MVLNEKRNISDYFNFKDKNLWALSLSALESDTDFHSKRIKYSEDIFHLHFIEIK